MVFSFLFGSKLVRQVPCGTGGLQGSWSPEIVPPCADLLMEVCYASSGQPRGGASAHRAADHPSPSVDHRVLADQRSHVAILSVPNL